MPCGMHIPYEWITHRRKVCSLYKNIMRDIECWVPDDRAKQRIQCVLMRQKFEENRKVADPIKARELLEAGIKKFNYIKHPDQKYFPNSPEGTAWRRGRSQPDWILDYWHPLEKMRYPDYFARREQRKLEFVQWYEKKYGSGMEEVHEGHHTVDDRERDEFETIRRQNQMRDMELAKDDEIPLLNKGMQSE